ncbi:MAG: hypothetical protein SGPRY_006553, partial [Prymnesium sp.]
VMTLLQKREGLQYVLLDTPGQIEIFTWSASGEIIARSLASAHPTIILYVVDTARCSDPLSFMSNMLHACSILYKMKLPLLLVFNKVDVAPLAPLRAWMNDLDSFTAALQRQSSYMGSLSASMALVLEEFYCSLTSVGVSALTGEGIDDFFGAIDAAAASFDWEAERRGGGGGGVERNRGKAAGGLGDLGAKVAPGFEDPEEKREEEEEEEEEEEGSYFNRSYFNTSYMYTAEDERFALEQPDEREDHQSLLRYLSKERQTTE